MAVGAQPRARRGGATASPFNDLAIRVNPAPPATISKTWRTTFACSGFTRRTTWLRTGRPSGRGGPGTLHLVAEVLRRDGEFRGRIRREDLLTGLVGKQPHAAHEQTFEGVAHLPLLAAEPVEVGDDEHVERPPRRLARGEQRHQPRTVERCA